MPPGLYDQIEVSYEIVEGASTHSTKVYWRSDKEDMSEKRALEGLEVALDDKNRRWKATFNMHYEGDWMKDNLLSRIRIDFYDFNSLGPVTNGTALAA